MRGLTNSMRAGMPPPAGRGREGGGMAGTDPAVADSALLSVEYLPGNSSSQTNLDPYFFKVIGYRSLRALTKSRKPFN